MVEPIGRISNLLGYVDWLVGWLSLRSCELRSYSHNEWLPKTVKDNIVSLYP